MKPSAQPACASHMPGPWTIDHSRHFENYQILGRFGGNQGMAVATLCDSTPEAQFNARLIAAAPELLASLSCLLMNAENKQAYINALTGKETFNEAGNAIVSDSPEMALARAAIAQATEGRTK